MLTEQEQAQVKRRFANSGKSIVVAYILWALTGLLGIHRFYNAKPKLGILSIALVAVSIIAIFVPVHTQMPEYTQCVQNAVKSFSPESAAPCEQQISQLSTLGSASMLLGAATLLFLLLWWLLDGVKMPRTVNHSNEKLRRVFESEVLKQRPQKED